ncbi:MAG: hypothetical protein E6Y25_05910 [Sneathia sanguinegens]|uniref:hypothetical protein n=1 Tax=Sneathia sanguinegens TaxID=40543 RepID=UPI00290A4CFF|nr:hypothetical protein [Sneathia sanguinegens]MDU4652946.1 hypothetical protein [Sneathia sanguinegens]
MPVARQIKIFSNFKKHSSKESKTRNDLCNLAKEYERIGEQKNPDINLKLSNENVILKHFEVKDYDEIVKNTDYSLNSPNSKYEDIYTTTPTIQATNFVNLGGVNLTFLAKKDEWVNFYKDVSSFIKNYLGDDFNTLCEVIQFDEFTPHLQLMGIFRSEVSNETLADKDLESDPKLFEEISRKQFTRYNNKLKGTDEYTDPKNKKEYKQAKIKWVEENKAEIIKNYKPRNKKTEKKYAYVRMNNPIAMKRYSYKDYQVKLFEFCKEHEFIKNLCDKATKIRGEEVSFVMNSTEPVYDGKSKDHYEIKETIERENKEIESKIKNGKDLTENEVYRYIRKKNRAILKKDFMNFDVNSWYKEFDKPQNALYDFKTKLSNDYIKVAQEVAYKPYIELKDNINQLSKTKNKVKEEIEEQEKEKENTIKNLHKAQEEYQKYINTDKWNSVQTLKNFDTTKKVITPSIFNRNTETVIQLSQKKYDEIYKMAMDNSSKLTHWYNKANDFEKKLNEKVNENKKLKDEIEKLETDNSNLKDENRKYEAKISFIDYAIKMFLKEQTYNKIKEIAEEIRDSWDLKKVKQKIDNFASLFGKNKNKYKDYDDDWERE